MLALLSLLLKAFLKVVSFWPSLGTQLEDGRKVAHYKDTAAFQYPSIFDTFLYKIPG